MVTARSPRCIPWTGMVPGALLRLLALAVLTFGVVITHGVHVESTMSHIPTSVTASRALPDGETREDVKELSPHRMGATDDDGNGPPHTGQHCASGQLPYRSIVASPCFAASVRESAASVHALAERGKPGFGFSGGSSFLALRTAVVQQV